VSGLQAVIHDATLTGNGTASNPLGVAVPLNLTGSVPNDFQTDPGVIRAINTADGGIGVSAHGGDSETFSGGDGVRAIGGKGNLRGGDGVDAQGGISNLLGGDGVFSQGGPGLGTGSRGGTGIVAFGGIGVNGATNGLAGQFNGGVEISGGVQIIGALNVTGTKNFKIDHPLDPENKYLYHAAVESAEVLNIYNGNVRLDQNGEATVKLPAWFESLNTDCRYSLTSIGSPGQGLYIAEEVSNNQFRIAGGTPRAKVSWQVTGVRSDAVMLKHPFKAEAEKAGRERGTYLSPEAYGQPEERGLDWARNPELMQQLKQRRLEAEQGRQRYRRVGR
jgi:hypothetical protein